MPKNPLLSNTHNNSNSNRISNNGWPMVKPFANGGLVGVISSSVGYLGFFGFNNMLLLTAKPENVADIRPMVNQVNTALLKRCPAFLLRDATYTAARLGSFEVLTKRLEAANGGKPLTLFQEVCCGLTSGAIGAFIFGSPLITILYTPPNASSDAQKLNHENVYREVKRTLTNKGVTAVYKGTSPASEIIAFNMAMLTSYKRSFSYLNQSLGFDEYQTWIGAGFVSGFVGSACSLPFVNVNSRMRVHDANGAKYLYTSFLDCAYASLKAEGPSIFFKGFFDHFRHVTPRVMGLWIMWEEMRKLEQHFEIEINRGKNIF